MVNECLNTRHDGRGERSSTRTRPRTRIGAAGRAPLRCVRPAENVVMAPETIGGEERNVWSVAQTVVRIAEYRLPRWLGPSRTCTPDNAVGGRGSSGALAGP